MSTSARLKAQQDLSEILNDAVRKKASTATQAKVAEPEADARFENIAANTFYKIMFSEEATPEEKKQAVAQALSFEGTKEENKERIKEFELFKEYLQNVREEMAQEIIRLTDTEAFSELKQVYDELNTSLNDFDDKMRPLTDIVEAIYKLRTNDMTFDAFKEIQEDKKWEAEQEAIRTQQQESLRKLQERMSGINRDIAVLGEQKGLFGLGGIKKEAREEIARKQVDLDTARTELSNLTSDIEKTSAERTQRESALGEFAAEKQKLRELLDITTDGHKERQKALVDAALTFVDTAKARVGSVREHLGKMNDQVENLFEANTNMSSVYAILTEGIKDAEGKNQAIRSDLLPKEGVEEDMIAKMTREQKKMAVEQHITLLDASAADTMSTYADLTSQTIRIKTMKDANDAQIAKARTMHSQGVAGVADRLSTVLQAVSSAALGESSAMAKDTLSRMTENTNRVAQKEVIRIAMGVTEQNEDLVKAIDDLGAYGEVVKAATNISREGITEMREKLSELQILAKGVQNDINESIAVNAEVGLGIKAKPEDKAEEKKGPAKPDNPFKFGPR